MVFQVLITDDSKLARKFIRKELAKCFEEGQVTLHEATTGREAVTHVLKDRDVDLMFLDLTMPEFDGYQVLETLQKFNLNIKIFVVSADIQTQAKERVLALGATDFIEKPIDESKLRTYLTRHGVLP